MLEVLAARAAFYENVKRRIHHGDTEGTEANQNPPCPPCLRGASLRGPASPGRFQFALAGRGGLAAAGGRVDEAHRAHRVRARCRRRSSHRASPRSAGARTHRRMTSARPRTGPRTAQSLLAVLPRAVSSLGARWRSRELPPPPVPGMPPPVPPGPARVGRGALEAVPVAHQPGAAGELAGAGVALLELHADPPAPTPKPPPALPANPRLLPKVLDAPAAPRGCTGCRSCSSR